MSGDADAGIPSVILTRGSGSSMTARAIPSIDQLTQRPGVQALVARYGHGAAVEALRAAAREVRERLAGGGACH